MEIWVAEWLWLLASFFIGVFLGCMTGLIPGFHVNNVALIALSLTPLAIGLGIFQLICSFLMLVWLPGDFFTKLLMFILMICIGVVLISLGARQVPDYSSLKYAIEDYVGSKIKHS